MDALGDGTRRLILERLRGGPRAVGELAAATVMERRLGDLGEPYHTGMAGAFARAAKTATAAGGLLGAVAGRRPVLGRLAAGLVLGGAVAERFAVFRAGFQSAEDPKYVVGPQRERVVARAA